MFVRRCGRYRHEAIETKDVGGNMSGNVGVAHSNEQTSRQKRATRFSINLQPVLVLRESINLPHSSRLISNMNNFAFELRSSILVLCCICVASCVLSLRRVIVASYFCLSRRLLAILASYSSLSNLLLKSIAAAFGSLTKARVEFVLLELRIQTAEQIVLALETSRTFFVWSYDYPLQRIGSRVSLRVTRVTHRVEASVSG